MNCAYAYTNEVQRLEGHPKICPKYEEFETGEEPNFFQYS